MRVGQGAKGEWPSACRFHSSRHIFLPGVGVGAPRFGRRGAAVEEVAVDRGGVEVAVAAAPWSPYPVVEGRIFPPPLTPVRW